MATYADGRDIVRLEQQWERSLTATPEEQARVNARHRAQSKDEARRIATMTERVILGPPGGAAGVAAWSREVRVDLERFRIAGSLRAYDGGADVLVLLEQMLQSKEASAAALLAEQSA